MKKTVLTFDFGDGLDFNLADIIGIMLDKPSRVGAGENMVTGKQWFQIVKHINGEDVMINMEEQPDVSWRITNF